MKLPSPLDLASIIRELGVGCMLYKVDLSRAYRQLRSDPLDWPFLGVKWEDQCFIDIAIPFGLRHCASACQRVSEAAAKVAKERFDGRTEAYVDDTAGAALPAVAMSHYVGLLTTLNELGLETVAGKCEPPATGMLWVGVWFDSIRMIMAIDPDRVREAIEECEAFLLAVTVTLHRMQKLMGKLFHAAKCTHSARAFMARMLDLLREAASRHIVSISEGARADARWLRTFLGGFNGVTRIKPGEPEITASVDSCLSGGGGECAGLGFYAVEYPEYIQVLGLAIASLECFNLLMALRLWARAWAGKHVKVFCDNWATVCSLGSCKAEDPIIRAALREVWMITAREDIQLSVEHRPGAEMVVADMLSRAHLSREGAQKLSEYQKGSGETRLRVSSSVLMPPIAL